MFIVQIRDDDDDVNGNGINVDVNAGNSNSGDAEKPDAELDELFSLFWQYFSFHFSSVWNEMSAVADLKRRLLRCGPMRAKKTVLS